MNNAHHPRLLLTFTLLISLGLFSMPAQANVIKETENPRANAIKQWRDLKFGLFIHWGLYSIPGGQWQGKDITLGYSEQIQAHGKIPAKDYQALTKKFNPKAYDPDAIAKLAKQAGMKYIVLTTKHHDGFNMFHTAHSDYNVVDATPYKKDTLKSLARACADHQLGLGLYYSLIDWHYPEALPISSHNSDKIPAAHEAFNLKQIKELMTNYGPIVEVWFDMSNPTLEQSQKFTQMVHQHQPNALVNGRVWNNQGDFLVMGDNKIPNYKIRQPWQTPASIYKATWGYRKWQVRKDLTRKTQEHIRNLVKVVGQGGNYLLNIGPKGDGSLVEFEANLLKGIGRWMAVNQESIYGTQMNPFDVPLSFGQVTHKKNKLYLHVIQRPKDGKLHLPGLKSKIKRVYRLDDPQKNALRIRETQAGLTVELPILRGRKDAILNAVNVVVVEYQGKLEIQRQNVIKPTAKGNIHLKNDQATDYFSMSGGDYYSTKRTTIEKLWAIQTQSQARYQITVKIEQKSKNKQEHYLLKIAGQTKRFSIEKDSAKIDVGQIKLPAGKTIECSLLLDNPKFKELDLGVKSVAIELKKI